MHPSLTITNTKGECTVYVRPFDPFPALEVWGELQAKFGPSLAPILGGGTEDGALQAGVERLFNSLRGPELRRIYSLAVQPDYVSISKSGDPPRKLDEAATNLMIEFDDMPEIFWFAVKVNFGRFLLKAINRIGEAISPELRQRLESSVML